MIVQKINHDMEYWGVPSTYLWELKVDEILANVSTNDQVDKQKFHYFTRINQFNPHNTMRERLLCPFFS